MEDEDEGALMEAYSSEEEVCKDSLATDHDVLSGAAIMKREPKRLLVNLAANDFENFLSTVMWNIYMTFFVKYVTCEILQIS